MGFEKPFRLVALSIALFHILILLSACEGHKVLCKAHEREALLHFKDGLRTLYSQEKVLSSWVEEEDCCKWEGIGCNNLTGHVVKLRLDGVRGNIGPSLLDLIHLQRLDLSFNDFGGSSIPDYFGSFKELRHLELLFSNISGTIPPQLGNLSTLEVLILFEFDGRLESDCTWISRLSSLHFLEMSGVSLSKATHLFRELNKLPFISDIEVSYCELDPLSLEVNLDYANFTHLSSLDVSYNYMEFQIPQWLFNVTNLEELDLSFNNISRSDEIAQNLCNPRRLYLSSINLTIDMVYFFKACNRRLHLEVLDLSSNQITGQLPSWLGDYNKLKGLDLAENSISGSIPESIGGIASLELLDLSYNNLTGSIPMSIGGLNSSNTCHLSCNNLSGSIPSLGRLKSLWYLDISENSLQGIVSDAFLNHSSLYRLDISGNSFKIMLSSNWVPPFSLWYLGMASCKVGQKFPVWLQTQSKLVYLNMSNSGISYDLPQWIWNFSPHLWIIDLSNNNITGVIPMAMDKSLVYFVDLRFNMLKGTLPSFSNTIGHLLLSNNKLSGPIHLRNVSLLIVLSLSNNNLSGKIPSSLCNATTLSILDLSNNHLSGHLPTCMGNSNQLIQQSCSIVSLHLNNNSLQGTLPRWLKICNNMRVIDMGENRFRGNIPSWITKSMPMLQVLRLRSNLFNGVIPLQLSNLKSLQVIDLAENNLSGSIPSTFGDFWSMKIRYSDNEIVGHLDHYMKNIGTMMIFINEVMDTGSIMVTFKNQDMQYDRILKFLTSMDLSGNRLSGEIPRELGDLCGLVNLNLSHNYLIGNIPESFGNLTQLESLDLSRNNISGRIPQSLSALTYLSKFNVSFNNLSGRIPTGNQFDGFPDSSYLGNTMLCGMPLNVCKSDQELVTPLMTKFEDNEYLWFYIAFVVGFVMGLWVFFGSLIIKRNWRDAYFQYIDQNQCKIHGSLFRR